MEEKEFGNMLGDILFEENAEEYFNEQEEITSITSFENEGLLTNDHGLVVRLVNGNKFYVTIQKIE